VGASVGMLYLNDAAIGNPHYSSDCALRARSVEGTAGHYNIFIRSVTVGGKTFTGFPCTQDLDTFCILDTGSSTTTFPQEVVDAIGDTGSLEIELEGPPGQPSAKLILDIAALGRVQETPIDGVPVPISESFVMLGLPTWAFYYTVFSSDGVTEFISHDCCSETPAPEPSTDAPMPQPKPAPPAPMPEPSGSMPDSVSDADSLAINEIMGKNVLSESPVRSSQSVGEVRWATVMAALTACAALVLVLRVWYFRSRVLVGELAMLPAAEGSVE